MKKSYTYLRLIILSIIEMATLMFNNLHSKPQPLTSIAYMIINHPLF